MLDHSDLMQLTGEVIQQAKGLTPAQQILLDKHGWPSDFAEACNRAADGLMITTAECQAAIAKYNQEWAAAGKP